MIVSKAAPALDRLAILRKMLLKNLSHLERKRDKQREELLETERAAWYRQIADSLLAKLAQGDIVQRGTSKFPVINIHTQQEETVSLNPKFNLRQNAELFYKKARKGERSREINSRKVSETENEIKKTEALVAEVDAALSDKSDENRILSRCVELESKLALPQSLPRGTVSIDKKDNIPYRHFTLDGWNIFTGKNDAQNDEMTTRFAKPQDLWLHVAGHAGSHIIIRRPDRTTLVPQDIIQKAASLAVWFSKAKHTSYAEVHVTEARFVYKRRHSPAGEVIAERCKSIRVSPRSPQDLFPSQYEM